MRNANWVRGWLAGAGTSLAVYLALEVQSPWALGIAALILLNVVVAAVRS